MQFPTRTNFIRPFLWALTLWSFFSLHGCGTAPKQPPKVPVQTNQELPPPPPQQAPTFTPQQLEQQARQALKDQNYAELTQVAQQLWQSTNDPDQRAAIQYQLWQVFKHLTPEQLDALQTDSKVETDMDMESEAGSKMDSEMTSDTDTVLDTWIHLAKAWQTQQGVNRLSAIENELDFIDNPEFFAPVLMLAKHDALRPQPLKKLAVFLPLSGKYQLLAFQIRDGLIKNILLKHPEISLSFYDTEENPDMATLYQQAMSEGNDWVIGPIKKKNIQQLEALPATNITALNQLDTPTNFMQFSLRTASEPVQIEDKLCQSHYRHLGILSSQTQSDLNLGQTLTYLWRQIPLHHAAFNSYPAHRPNLRKALGNLINETQSQYRKANLRWLLQEKLYFFPRTRKDLQAIVLIGNRKRVAVFKPQFKFFNLKLPVYGSSNLSPTNLQQAEPIKDLSDVVFPTYPAVVSPSPVMTLLEAFGWDSVELTLNHTRLAPNLCYNPGLTGALQIESDKKVDRHLIWAKYKHDGSIQPVE